MNMAGRVASPGIYRRYGALCREFPRPQSLIGNRAVLRRLDHKIACILIKGRLQKQLAKLRFRFSTAKMKTFDFSPSGIAKGTNSNVSVLRVLGTLFLFFVKAFFLLFVFAPLMILGLLKVLGF
jgi:hypothetical protein